jgi:hypothetical protein
MQLQNNINEKVSILYNSHGTSNQIPQCHCSQDFFLRPLSSLIIYKSPQLTVSITNKSTTNMQMIQNSSLILGHSLSNSCYIPLSERCFILPLPWFFYFFIFISIYNLYSGISFGHFHMCLQCTLVSFIPHYAPSSCSLILSLKTISPCFIVLFSYKYSK